MKVLAIGNSYSCDGTRYLWQIAQSVGETITVANLVIGGCPLRKHYVNALDDAKAYDLHFNGTNTGFRVSIKEALIAHDWDVVTLQQASRDSVDFDTYVPYLDFLAEQIRLYAPKAKIYIHQTWAYTEAQSQTLGFSGHAAMLQAILPAYEQAKERISAAGMIPDGEVMGALKECREESEIYRDAIHASYGLGRYALALTWFATLTGKDIAQVPFDDFDAPVSKEQMDVAKEIVARVIASHAN
jgi:hypothetical protein